MGLSSDLNRNIQQAWLNLRQKILSNPQDLQKRLARRRSPTLTRPPRAWCLALRASDRRITPMHWILTPMHAMDLNHPAHPYEPIEHTVTIQKHGLRRLCNPVTFSIERAVNVARIFGVSDSMLLGARRRGKFFEDFKKGPRGPRVPFLSPNGQIFDPNHHDFSPPHPIWGSSWEWLSHLIPDDFEQTITRTPLFRRHPAGMRIPQDQLPLGPEDFLLRGYRWLCPKCKKPAATIYYPLPVRTPFGWPGFPFDHPFKDPVHQLKLCDADLPQPPPPTFACMRCHNIAYFSSIKHDAWNHVITYLSAGLLYGSEVEKPASFLPERKRTRIRQLNRLAPAREQVFDRLRLRFSPVQIAADLGKSLNAIKCAIRQICKQERVKDLHALAQKLQFPLAPSLTPPQRAVLRRPLIQEMLLRDCTHEEMSKALNIPHPVLQKDILAIYQKHNIKGHPWTARPQLAEKLGLPFTCRREEFPLPPDQLHARIDELRQSGMKWKDIATEMRVSNAKMDSYRVMLSRSRKNAHLEQLPGRPASSVAPPSPQTPPIASVALS